MVHNCGSSVVTVVAAVLATPKLIVLTESWYNKLWYIAYYKKV